MMSKPIHPAVVTPALPSLIACFQDLPDPRVDRTKNHKLIDILVISICTLLCCGESFNDMEEFGNAKHDWLKSFLELPNGIPAHDTFNRVFAALDPQRFLDCFLRWTQSLRTAVAGEIVAMDGKALRRALDQGQALPYVVSAWAVENGLVLGQLKVADKSNEITAVPELLRALELRGCIVTTDAMGCQKKIAKQIIDSGADYVLALKGNHETVHEEVKTYLDDAIRQQAADRSARRRTKTSELVYLETVEKDHGRLETRRYWQSENIDWFADLTKWEGLRSVGVVEAVRASKGQTSTDRRYYLSSLSCDITRFAKAVRGHWGVENQVHWHMDVSFGEDHSRARTGHAAENLATLRRLALNLLKRETTKKRGIRGKQRCAGWDHRYLLHLLSIAPT
jgi:predicted transposase YbfD/YdcC